MSTMRKLILEEWVSLDGYVADRNGQLDFFTSLTPEQNKYSGADQLRFLETIDTILLGRITYELFADFWPTATTWGEWPEAEVVSGDAVEAIRKLKLLPGKDMVMWGSISLAQSLMKENLIDEYHIQLCPVLTGGGRTLFTPQLNPAQLNLLEVRHYTAGTVFLNYQLAKH